jgi:hypothetical protein
METYGSASKQNTSKYHGSATLSPTFFCSFVFMSTAYSSLVTSHSSTKVWMCNTDLGKRGRGSRGGGVHGHSASDYVGGDAFVDGLGLGRGTGDGQREGEGAMVTSHSK